MKKIKKIEESEHLSDIVYRTMYKVNDIIDRLNFQEQPEWYDPSMKTKVCTVCGKEWSSNAPLTEGKYVCTPCKVRARQPEKENTVNYMQVAHCRKCGGYGGFNVIGEKKVCADCGEEYTPDFTVPHFQESITVGFSEDRLNFQEQPEGMANIVAPSMNNMTAGEIRSLRHVKPELSKKEQPEVEASFTDALTEMDKIENSIPEKANENWKGRCMKCGSKENLNTNEERSFIECDRCMWESNTDKDWKKDFLSSLMDYIEGSKEKEDLVEFISGLLKEREQFNKEELFMLKLATNDIYNKGNKTYNDISEKIERLLSKGGN